MEKQDGMKEKQCRLERWLSSYEHWLFFQTAWVHFLGPAWQFTAVCNSSCKESNTLLASSGIASMWCTDTHTHKIGGGGLFIYLFVSFLQSSRYPPPDPTLWQFLISCLLPPDLLSLISEFCFVFVCGTVWVCAYIGDVERRYTGLCGFWITTWSWAQKWMKLLFHFLVQKFM